MSNLYIRVKTGFYTHRKTLRLRSLIGDAAYWVPLKMWAYCAENQPDGNLSDYTDSELAMLIGCSSNATSNATSIVEALREAGFIDENGHVHDWQDHNSYHKNFSDRAKVAAAERWRLERLRKAQDGEKNKEIPPTPPKEDIGKRKGETSIASSNACSITSNASSNACSITDDVFVVETAKNPAFAGIDVSREYHKMCAWCKVNKRLPSRRRFINWLNRIEKPMVAPPVTKLWGNNSTTPVTKVW